MADNLNFIDDNFSFDFSKDLDWNLKELKLKLIRDGMTEDEANNLINEKIKNYKPAYFFLTIFWLLFPWMFQSSFQFTPRAEYHAPMGRDGYGFPGLRIARAVCFTLFHFQRA